MLQIRKGENNQKELSMQYQRAPIIGRPQCEKKQSPIGTKWQ
jgi:hypothetical protein